MCKRNRPGAIEWSWEWCCPLSFHNQDEPVVVLKWHVVSSLGSWLSFVGVLYFLFIVWEALVSQRGVVCKRNGNMNTVLGSGLV